MTQRGTIDEFREYLRVQHGVTAEDLQIFEELGIEIRLCECGCGVWQLVPGSYARLASGEWDGLTQDAAATKGAAT